MEIKPNDVPANDLTAKEVGDYGASVGKEVMRTTLVWTLAGVATQFIRDLMKYFKPK